MSKPTESLEHKRLVRLALLKAIAEVDNIVVINLSLPIGSIAAHIDVSSHLTDRWSVSSYATKHFEPDIACITYEGTLETTTMSFGRTEEVKKMGLVLIEAETGKRNLLADTYRKTAYKLLKLQQRETHPLRLILAVWSDLNLEGTPEPFDEVWRFPRNLKA